MESSTALLHAASGLERLMKGTPTNKAIKDSNVAQISAFLYHQANVVAGIESNAAFKKLFKKTVFDGINKEFGEYLDAKARVKPASLHHVYEWNKAGNPTSRLFKLNRLEAPGLSFKIDTGFILSKTSVPNKNKKQKKKYVFAQKASVMEAGMPVIIRPKSADRLVFEHDGITVFMPKGASVTVKSPGGRASTNQFQLAYSQFFSGNLVNIAIKNSGFPSLFKAGMSKALSVPGSIKKIQYSFSPNAIKQEADLSLQKAFGGVV